MSNVQKMAKQAFSRFFIFAEISEILKKNRLENLFLQWNEKSGFTHVPCKILLIYFDANRVSIVISWERDVETGENKWKVFKTKA